MPTQADSLLPPGLCLRRALVGRVPDGSTGGGVQATIEVAAGLAQLGVELDGFPVVADGLVELALLAQCMAQMSVGRGRRLRVEPDGFLELADRLVQLPPGAENKTEVAVGCGASLRIDPNGFLELVDRLVQPALFHQGNPEVVVDQGEVRVAGEGLLQLVNGFVQPAKVT